MTESEQEEFLIWQRTRHKTAFDMAFQDLEDMLADMKGYNVTMPTRAFKTVARALLLLKEESCSKK
jgi:aspartate aminotransferase-like enzyme